MEKQPLTNNKSSKEDNSDNHNHIRAPYVPLATSRKLISTLGWSVVGLVIVCIVLSIGFTTSIQRQPWIIADGPDGYKDMKLGRHKATRGEIERFLNFAIPNLYGSVNAEGPGLKELRGLVDARVLRLQQEALSSSKQSLKEEGISQFAIVTGINPETLAIDRVSNKAYAEVYGTVMLTQENKTKKTDVQWRCLIYLLEPSKDIKSKTPGGIMLGNRMGLFLEQIEEQPPGTVNKDGLKPTNQDAQEREDEKKEEQAQPQP